MVFFFYSKTFQSVFFLSFSYDRRISLTGVVFDFCTDIQLERVAFLSFTFPTQSYKNPQNQMVDPNVLCDLKIPTPTLDIGRPVNVGSVMGNQLEGKKVVYR